MLGAGALGRLGRAACDVGELLVRLGVRPAPGDGLASVGSAASVFSGVGSDGSDGLELACLGAGGAVCSVDGSCGASGFAELRSIVGTGATCVGTDTEFA
ncbi:MAG: hypothetical protein Aurels2KO_28960 [Aureliella sp.]